MSTWKHKYRGDFKVIYYTNTNRLKVLPTGNKFWNNRCKEDAKKPDGPDNIYPDGRKTWFHKGSFERLKDCRAL